MMGGGKAFLVALMFVTILTLGIASILTTLASAIVKGDGARSRAIQFGWVGIVLLSYLDLFWQSDFLLTIDEWRFFQFLLILSGPIVLLFATQVLLASISGEGEPAGTGEPPIGRRFIVLMLCLEVWFVSVSIAFVGPQLNNLLDVVFTTVLLTMYVSRTAKTQAYATVAAATVYILSLALLGQVS